ncbi:hypothetical protein AFLA_011628 [Aspergillus flavus NRRL3357]|nr:hypothetical protein AFLA_011628 [Aspergillus flavus NRRL3357]
MLLLFWTSEVRFYIDVILHHPCQTLLPMMDLNFVIGIIVIPFGILFQEKWSRFCSYGGLPRGCESPIYVSISQFKCGHTVLIAAIEGEAEGYEYCRTNQPYYRLYMQIASDPI